MTDDKTTAVPDGQNVPGAGRPAAVAATTSVDPQRFDEAQQTDDHRGDEPAVAPEAFGEQRTDVIDPLSMPTSGEPAAVSAHDVDGAAARNHAAAPDDTADSQDVESAPVHVSREAGGKPQYGVGPLSIREVAIVGVWALGFLFSFFPIYGRFGAGSSVWSAGIDWVLTIGVPTVAVFLVILRRFSPQGIRRVGSLGIDQFASVAFSVSAVIWLGIIWGAFVALSQTGVFVAGWVVWVELILMLAGVVLTVLAPHLPVLGEDFRYRPESPAHRIARGTRPVSARPASARPAHVGAPAAVATADNVGDDSGHAASGTPSSSVTDSAAEYGGSDPVTEVFAEPAAPATQAFWALAPEERDVVDEQGSPLFRIGPTAWALVIEDRGEAFVVRHEDGRVGFLHDTSGVTRG